MRSGSRFNGLMKTPKAVKTADRENAHDCTWLKPGVTHNKKNREENKFSPRVEVRVVTPKKSGAVNSAIGLVPFLFRCFFLCCFLFSHRLIPPFQSATRGTGEELGMTSLNWVQ
jgi:hypothetical protein